MAEYVSEYTANLATVAETFNVSESTARKWLYSGAIPENAYIRVNGLYRFSLPKVEAGLLAAKHGGTQMEMDFGEESVDPRKYYKPKD